MLARPDLVSLALFAAVVFIQIGQIEHSWRIQNRAVYFGRATVIEKNHGIAVKGLDQVVPAVGFYFQFVIFKGMKIVLRYPVTNQLHKPVAIETGGNLLAVFPDHLVARKHYRGFKNAVILFAVLTKQGARTKKTNRQAQQYHSLK